MCKLEEEHPDVFLAFKNGLQVVRRSERFWAGLSSDLIIEQVLMQSVKTTGGLTRGRGFSETQGLFGYYQHQLQQKLTMLCKV